MKKLSTFITGVICFLLSGNLWARSFQLYSPDKTIRVEVQTEKLIQYQIFLDGKALTAPAEIALKTSFSGDDWKIKSTVTNNVDQWLTPAVPQKSDRIHDQYNELRLLFSNGLALEWKAYNNGIGWHWVSNVKTAYQVINEKANFGFASTDSTWYPLEDGFFSHNERAYKHWPLSEVGEKQLASLPALFSVKGTKILLTESGLYDYAGMWLRGDGNGGIVADFPHYPKETKIEGDRSEVVLSREDYIAKETGAKDFPWRIMMIAREDKDLLGNQLVYQFAPAAKGDYSWVAPGKVQWDWWHYNNVYDVPFRAGINNDTYKYYIDFAAAHKIEYVLLDEGWCDTRDLFKQSKDIDIETLADYAASKNVGLILWSSWLVLDQQMIPALDQFAKWGIKGIKVDFMQRDDQKMVEYYERVAEEAAKRHLLVDFHGAYKPVGWLRTHPNVLTSEGVMGNEISKFANSITPEHTATLPFTRMVAGPMDFTPGGMRNVQKDAFAAEPAEPMTLGTRCNQMAMYVIFESPLQMLCDIPTHYIKEPECMQFLSAVPAVWKQTIPLEGKVSQYVAMARQALNGDWYLGAMTDWDSRHFSVKLDFLPMGKKFKMLVWKDGPNADRNAKDFAMETLTVDRNSVVDMQLSKGGGYVARLIAID